MSHGEGIRSLLAEHWHLALTLRGMRIRFDRDRCLGAWECIDVCPVGCWSEDRDARKAVFQGAAHCIACGACVLQCPAGAIELT